MTNLGPVTQHRTQLYLPTSLYQKVKQKVNEEGISMAEFFRSLLKEEFKKEDKKEKEKAWREFYKLVGIGKGPKDLSYSHDRYLTESLWEEDRKEKKEYLREKEKKGK